MLLRVKARQFTFGELLFVGVKCMRMWVLLGNFLIRQRKTHRRIVDDGFYLFKGDSAGVEVELRVHDLPALAVFAFVRSRHSRLNSLNHNFASDTAFLEFSEH